MFRWLLPRPPTHAAPMEFELDSLLATLAQVAATQGDAAVVATLADGTADVVLDEQFHDFGEEWCQYRLRLALEPGLYGRLGAEREKVAARLRDLAFELTSGYDAHHAINKVSLVARVEPMDGWRESARGWARGEGINNQGRVRSNNIAGRQHDGLLFRSQPEIHLYNALKSRGVYLAPLPVFLRGGPGYQRLEPDFVLIRQGVVMVVEVDGATVHRESPAEAHARVQGLLREGVRVERVQAVDCASPQAAERCADGLVAALERYQALRV